MNEEKLMSILENLWYNLISVDDAFELIEEMFYDN